MIGSTRRDDGDGVGDEAAVHHVRAASGGSRSSGPRMCMRYGLARAVADDVAAELAAGRLDGDVGLALGHLEALGEDLEVVDQRLHRLVDAGPRRRRDLLVLDAVVAGRASGRGSGATMRIDSRISLRRMA